MTPRTRIHAADCRCRICRPRRLRGRLLLLGLTLAIATAISAAGGPSPLVLIGGSE